MYYNDSNNGCCLFSCLWKKTYFFVALGALNWGLIGLLDFNLVTAIFSEYTCVVNTLYMLIGAAGFVSIMYALRVIGYNIVNKKKDKSGKSKFCLARIFHVKVRLLSSIGALNWGLISLLNLDLVKALTFGHDCVAKLVYILVGLNGMFMFAFFRKNYSKALKSMQCNNSQTCSIK